METLNKSGISPSFDKIVIEPIKIEKKTKGGIVLPDETHQKEELAATIGTILAAGGDAQANLDVDGIKVGDTVLFWRYSGFRYPVAGVNYWICKWQNVLGKAETLPDYMLSGAQDAFPGNQLVA